MGISSVGNIGGYRPVTRTTADGSQQALFYRRESSAPATPSAAPMTSYAPAISPPATGTLLAAQEQRFYTRSSLSPTATADAPAVAPTQAEPTQAEPTQDTQASTYVRRSDTDPYSYRTDATATDFAQAAAVRSSLSFTNEAPQVDAANADLLKKVAGVYDPGQTAGASGTVSGLVDRGPALSATVFNFALNRDTSNFALRAEGDLGGVSLLDALKNGALQIDVQKWGGVGNAGQNASALSLSGSAYNVASFNDGGTGSTNIRHNQTDLGADTVGATFGGFAARDGLTFTVRSYDPSINVSNLKLLTA